MKKKQYKIYAIVDVIEGVPVYIGSTSRTLKQRFQGHCTCPSSAMYDYINAYGKDAVSYFVLREVPFGSDGNLSEEALVNRTNADLANVLNEAAILAARQNKKIIELPDLFEAIEKVIMGPERKSRIISDDEKKITAYHEAGHAVVANFLPNAAPIATDKP